MSALSDGVDVGTDGFSVHRWKQPVPTSSYLIALAVGSLASKDLSSRVRIWAEPEIVAAAAFEFSETEDFLTAGNELEFVCPLASIFNNRMSY